MKRRFLKTLVALCSATALMMFSAACGSKDNNQTATIKGAAVEKIERQPFKMPTLEEMMASMGGAAGGGMPGAAGGAPGAAGGAPGGAPGAAGGAPGGAGGPPGAGGPGGGVKSTPAVYIDNGRYSAGQSKKDVVAEGKITDTYASGVKITAKDGNVGGVYVKGIGSEYILSDATIELSGNGSGLGGPGSGAASDDHGTLIIKNANITTSGTARSATSATGYSTLKVYNSTLTSHGVPFEQSKSSPPEHLEIEGNSRTHVTMSNSYSYFYYSTIAADGWAALSTDGAEGFVYLEANNCKVQTVNSGYGTYADGACHNYFNNCDFDVASMAAIIAGEADCTFRDTNARCGTYFAMIHCVMGMPAEVSTLKVTGGEITCKSPAVLVNSQNAIINFDGVKMVSESGILIKSAINDDPNATKTKGQKVYGIRLNLKGMDVAGDIVHEDADRNMYLSLHATTLRGAIKDAIITLDGASRWTATADSRVTIEGSLSVSQIDAPRGVTINAIAGEEGTFTLSSGGTLILKKS
jgi:hypothetical protein